MTYNYLREKAKDYKLGKDKQLTQKGQLKMNLSRNVYIDLINEYNKLHDLPELSFDDIVEPKMSKKVLYSQAKQRGIPVKWIGSTVEEIKRLLNEKRNYDNDLVSANVTFGVYYFDILDRTYNKIFNEKRKDLNVAINQYIDATNREYEMRDMNVREISREVIILPTQATPNSILNMPLRQTGTYNISGFIDNAIWNTTPNECVIDYICNQYNIYSRDTIKKYIKNIDYITGNDVIEIARILEVNIYITHHSKLIYKAENQRSGSRKQKCMFFEVRNNHIYPIYELKEIRSLITSNSSGSKKQNNKIKHYKKIVFSNNAGIAPQYTDSIGFLCEKIKETNCMPKEKIKMSKGKIKSFVIKDVLYVCTPYDPNMAEYCEKNSIQYIGQSITKYIKPHMDMIPLSFFNIRIINHLSMPCVKFRNHLGNPYNRQSYPDDVAIDMNRCYTSCIIDNYDSFMTIDFDTVDTSAQPYDSYGLHYVETDDMTLLHKSNWYSNKILERAVQDGIEFKCKRFIRGTRTNFSFNDVVSQLTESFGNQAKLAINSLIGLLGQTNVNTASLAIDTNEEMIIDICKKSNLFVFKNDDLFFYGTEHKYFKHKNYLPIWIQILDWSNIRLHDLIMKHGTYSNLVYRKTDMAIMRNVSVNVSTDIGGYKIENNPVHQQTYNTIRNVPLLTLNENWHDISSSDILTHIKHKSLLLYGRAGTGKSWYIREFSKNHNTVRLSFTNKAANNISGKTCHKFFKIGSNETVNLKQALKADAIFIDEITMIPEYIWSFIIDLKNNTNVPIILVGDDRQLPPVGEDSHFNNPSIYWLTDGYKVELTEMQRYDIALWDYLENPYDLPLVDFDYDAMHICYTNNCVDSVNARMNKYHVSNPICVVDDILLDINVPLVAELTNKDIIKNETYKIEMFYREQRSCSQNTQGVFYRNHVPYSTEAFDCIDSNIVFKVYDCDFLFPITSFKKYFSLGYAMTTHKMQGSTVEGKLQIHEITTASNRRLFYTAYSRATKLSNISYSL